jgi:hypothetical protein
MGTRATVVFTGHVSITAEPPDGGHTRRRLLGVAALGALGVTAPAGCGIFDDEPEPAPPPDPLTPVLAEAVTLAAAYDRIIVARPDLGDRLAPFAAAHKAHAAELSRVTGAPVGVATATSAGPPTDDPKAALAALRRAEQAAQKTATTLCRQAAANRAALVGSIAAARACHAEALR